MNRRRFLALSGVGGSSAVVGCLEREPADSSPDDGTGGGSNGKETTNTAAELQPLADGDGVYASANGTYSESAAWLRSADDLESILPAFDDAAHEAVSAYVRDTDFGTSGVIAYATSFSSSGYDLSFDGSAIRNDRIVADFAAEEDDDAGIVATAAVHIVALKRIEVADPPSLLVVDGDEGTVSNRYEIRLERLSGDELGELPAEDELTDQAVADLSDVQADAHPPIRSAIEDGERELEKVPDPLARAVANHRYVRDGNDHYELTSEFPEYVLSSEIHDRDAVDVEPEHGSVLDLRDLRDDSEAAYEMVVTAMGETSGNARRVALPSALETVLEEYDYVWRSPTFVELDVSVDDPGAPYRLAATPVSRTKVLAELDEDDMLLAVDDLSERARQEVETALENDRGNAHEVYNPPALLEVNPPMTHKADKYLSYVVVDDAVYRTVVSDVVGDAW